MKLRKLNRDTHRDLGYIFFAMSVIYGLSGISLNHIKDWNPNYIVENQHFKTSLIEETGIDKQKVLSLLDSLGEKDNFKKFYYPSANTLKIFINNGSVIINTKTGEANLEKLTRRPVFYEFNWFHYNHAKRFYTWFADIYGIALILLATTGLFMLKGKNSITGRGAWLTAAGVIIPIIFYLLYAL